VLLIILLFLLCYCLSCAVDKDPRRRRPAALTRLHLSQRNQIRTLRQRCPGPAALPAPRSSRGHRGNEEGPSCRASVQVEGTLCGGQWGRYSPSEGPGGVPCASAAEGKYLASQPFILHHETHQPSARESFKLCGYQCFLLVQMHGTL
jgi:hypothetical protein